VSTANSNDVNGENQAKQNDPKQRVLVYLSYMNLFIDFYLLFVYFKKEEYYNQYKDCLKLLSTKNYQEAESNFKLLLQNLQEEPVRSLLSFNYNLNIDL
jgi:hypothetical protein